MLSGANTSLSKCPVQAEQASATNAPEHDLIQRAKAAWPEAIVEQNQHGQIQVKFEYGAGPFFRMREKILAQNSEIRLGKAPILPPSIPAGKNVFVQHELLRELAADFLTGFKTSHDKKIAGTAVGRPLQLAEAGLYALTSQTYLQAGLASNRRTTEVELNPPVVPIIGDIFIDGKKLDDSTLQKLGIYRVVHAPSSDCPSLKPAEAEQQKLLVLEHGRRGCTLPVVGQVKLYPTEYGGITFDRAKAATDRTVTLDYCAVQWIGCGTHKYTHHYREHAGSSGIKIDAEQVLLVDEIAFAAMRSTPVHDLRYSGTSGIILDLPHQTGFLPTPIGGFSKPHIALKRDALLMEHGAILSGITIAEYPLFTREQLNAVTGTDNNMVADSLVIQQRLVFDDTRRLEDLMRCDDAELAQEFVKSTFDFGPEVPQKLLNLVYVQELAGTIIHNFKVCLKLNIGVARNQNTSDNLSLRGGIIDPESLAEPENFYAKARLGIRWLFDLIKTAEQLGINDKQFLDCFAKDIVIKLFAGYSKGEEQRRIYFGDEQLKSLPYPTFFAESVMGSALLLELRETNKVVPFPELVRFLASDEVWADLLMPGFSKPYELVQDIATKIDEWEKKNGRSYPAVPLTENLQSLHENLEFNYLHLMCRLELMPKQRWPQSIRDRLPKIIEPVA